MLVRDPDAIFKDPILVCVINGEHKNLLRYAARCEMCPLAMAISYAALIGRFEPSDKSQPYDNLIKGLMAKKDTQGRFVYDLKDALLRYLDLQFTDKLGLAVQGNSRSKAYGYTNGLLALMSRLQITLSSVLDNPLSIVVAQINVKACSYLAAQNEGCHNAASFINNIIHREMAVKALLAAGEGLHENKLACAEVLKSTKQKLGNLTHNTVIDSLNQMIAMFTAQAKVEYLPDEQFNQLMASGSSSNEFEQKASENEFEHKTSWVTPCVRVGYGQAWAKFSDFIGPLLSGYMGPDLTQGSHWLKFSPEQYAQYVPRLGRGSGQLLKGFRRVVSGKEMPKRTDFLPVENLGAFCKLPVFLMKKIVDCLSGSDLYKLVLHGRYFNKFTVACLPPFGVMALSARVDTEMPQRHQSNEFEQKASENEFEQKASENEFEHKTSEQPVAMGQ